MSQRVWSFKNVFGKQKTRTLWHEKRGGGRFRSQILHAAIFRKIRSNSTHPSRNEIQMILKTKYIPFRPVLSPSTRVLLLTPEIRSKQNSHTLFPHTHRCENGKKLYFLYQPTPYYETLLLAKSTSKLDRISTRALGQPKKPKKK